MKKTLKTRIKITKSGKKLRRAPTLGHSRANKRQVQIKRKKNLREIKISLKKLKTAL
jgi:hypothetical protein